MTLVILTGCSGSDLRQAAIIGGAAGGGAAVGNSLGHGKKEQALYAAAGGAAGAAAGALIAGPNKDYGDKRYQEGYDQASNDDVKNLYEMKQALEKGTSGGGHQTYYALPAQELAPDGTRYVPHQVIVPVVE
jgi:hypothetical protein